MTSNRFWRGAAIGVLCALGFVGGCAGNPNNPDPYEKSNRAVYKFNDGLDRFVLKPASDVYVAVIPRPVRAGVTNVFANLAYPYVILNDFLQGKTRQGWADVGRMAMNTTYGIGGIFDVATKAKLPAHDNNFGNTMAHWGAKPGPYLVLPLFGPSTARDAPGLAVDAVTDPLFWIHLRWQYTYAIVGLDLVDARSRSQFGINLRDRAALDPYVFTRQAYLQSREAQVHEGRPQPTEPGLYDEDETTTAPSTAPATAPSH